MPCLPRPQIGNRGAACSEAGPRDKWWQAEEPSWAGEELEERLVGVGQGVVGTGDVAGARKEGAEALR